MNNTPAAVEATLEEHAGLCRRVQDGVPDGRQIPVSFDNMANAIEAFEATLITPNSRFDKFLDGRRQRA